MPGNHYDCGVDSHFSQFVENFHAVHLRHLDVTENHAVFFLLHHLAALNTVFRDIHIIAFVRQYLLQRVSDGPFIINNKNFHIVQKFMFLTKSGKYSES